MKNCLTLTVPWRVSPNWNWGKTLFPVAKEREQKLALEKRKNSNGTWVSVSLVYFSCQLLVSSTSIVDGCSAAFQWRKNYMKNSGHRIRIMNLMHWWMGPESFPSLSDTLLIEGTLLLSIRLLLDFINVHGLELLMIAKYRLQSVCKVRSSAFEKIGTWIWLTTGDTRLNLSISALTAKMQTVHIYICKQTTLKTKNRMKSDPSFWERYLICELSKIESPPNWIHSKQRMFLVSLAAIRLTRFWKNQGCSFLLLPSPTHFIHSQIFHFCLHSNG